MTLRAASRVVSAEKVFACRTVGFGTRNYALLSRTEKRLTETEKGLTAQFRFIRPLVRSVSFLLAVVLFAFLVSTGVEAARSCRNAIVVQKASRSFIAAARSGSVKAFERALRRHLAISRIALFALGRQARRLSPKDRRRYVNLAARYIARQMAAHSGAFRNARVEILRCRGNLVEGKVLPRGEIMRWRVKGSRIVDVNMSGVWLAMALRDHFRTLIQRKGGDVHAFLASLK